MAADPTMLATVQNALAAKPITAPEPNKSHEAMREASRQFEATFVNEMIGFMTQGVPTDGPFDGGNGEAMMRSMLNDEYAKSVAARGGVGLSDNVYRELLAIQEGPSHAAPGAKSQQ